MLNGEIGDYVTIARKDRNRDDWYLGSVTDEKARDVANRARLFSIPGKRTYRPKSIAMATTPAFDTNPHAIAIERRPARRTDIWPIRIASGGGFAIRFVAPAD